MPIAFPAYLCILALHIYISKNQAGGGISILYIALALFSVFAMRPLFKASEHGVTANNHFSKFKYGVLFLILSVFITAACINISAYPINYKEADMLPVISQMNNRFFQCQPVYAPIPEIWNGIKPVYLPAMWLPYGAPALLGIDIRWMNILCLSVCFILLFAPVRSLQTLMGATVISLLLLWYFIFIFAGFIRFTEEPLICAYYLLLAHCLVKQYWRAAFCLAALCLMGRYWLLPWIPLFLIFTVMHLRKKWIPKALPAVALLVILLAIIPPSVYAWLLSLPGHYAAAIADPGNAFKYDSVIASYGIVRFVPPHLYKYLPVAGIVFAAVIYSGYWLLKKKTPAPFQLAQLLAATLVTMTVCSVIPYEYLFMPMLFCAGYLIIYKWNEAGHIHQAS